VKEQRKREEGKGKGRETDKIRTHNRCVSKFEKVNFKKKI